MRKAERLFQLLTILRSRRTAVTARILAERLQVSERTIYRDIQALSLSGVPIQGEAGVGYQLHPGFTVPPLMFDLEELEALLLGVRMVQGWSDEALGQAADSALQKIRSALPDRQHFESVIKPEWLLVPDFHRDRCAIHSDKLRRVIKQQQVVEIDYSREDKQLSTRKIWPLGLVFWGRVWTLVSWCELREEYRMFRLDRIERLNIVDGHFTTTDTVSLQHYLQQMKSTN